MSERKRRKKWPWALLGAAVAVPALSIVSCSLVSSLTKAVPHDYYDSQETGGEIEEKYAPLGEYQVESAVYKAPEKETVDGKTYERNIKVWHPSDTSSTYPLVIMVNGTGVPYTKYEQVFEHLASWGFVVAGNDYSVTWSVSSSDATLEFVKSNAEVSAWCDLTRIGIGGHSQGGLGAYNAITESEHRAEYKAAFALSATSKKLSMALDWSHNAGEDDEYAYDLSKASAPVLMFAGTGDFDAKEEEGNEGICPLYSLKENFAEIPDGVHAAMARRKDADHGDMLWRSDPYVTAWLRMNLCGDDVSSAFYGEESELSANQYWQDAASK
jgi:dienelactone hydrolase